MENIRFKCPRCRMDLEVESNAAGRTAACPECKQLITIPAAVVAPEVIQPVTPPTPPPRPSPVTPAPPPAPQKIKRTSGLAVTSLIMGIISIFPGLLCCGPLFAILGIVFALVSQSQIRRQPDVFEGKGLAVAGLVTSIVGLVIVLIIAILFSVFGIGTAACMHEFQKAMQASHR